MLFQRFCEREAVLRLSAWIQLVRVPVSRGYACLHSQQQLSSMFANANGAFEHRNHSSTATQPIAAQSTATAAAIAAAAAAAAATESPSSAAAKSAAESAAAAADAAAQPAAAVSHRSAGAVLQRVHVGERQHARNE